MLKHGTYSYEVQNKIIIFSLEGDFNEYGMLACLDAEKKAIENFGEKQCSLLVDCRKVTGATPETYQVVDDFYHEIDYENLSAIALVHTSEILARLEERDIPHMKDYKVQVFMDRGPAIAWLESNQA